MPMNHHRGFIEYLDNDLGTDEPNPPIVMSIDDPWKDDISCSINLDHNCTFLNPLPIIPEGTAEEQQQQQQPPQLLHHHGYHPIPLNAIQAKVVAHWYPNTTNTNNKKNIKQVHQNPSSSSSSSSSQSNQYSYHPIVSGGWYGLALSITEDQQHYGPRHGRSMNSTDDDGASEPLPPREHDNDPWAELHDPHHYQCDRYHHHHHHHHHDGTIATTQQRHRQHPCKRYGSSRSSTTSTTTTKRHHPGQHNHDSHHHHHHHIHRIDHMPRPLFHPHYHFHGNSSPLSYSRNELVSIHEVINENENENENNDNNGVDVDHEEKIFQLYDDDDILVYDEDDTPSTTTTTTTTATTTTATSTTTTTTTSQEVISNE